MSNTKMILAAVAAALAVLVLVPYATSIQCYQCNSAKDPHCADVKKNVSAARGYLKECTDALPNKAKPFCRKIVQTILNKNERRVIRKCGYEQSPKPCYNFDDDDHNEVVCQCFDEACNAATRANPAAALAATGVATLLMMLAR